VAGGPTATKLDDTYFGAASRFYRVLLHPQSP
jgi:hypothetical protein